MGRTERRSEVEERTKVDGKRSEDVWSVGG